MKKITQRVLLLFTVAILGVGGALAGDTPMVGYSAAATSCGKFIESRKSVGNDHDYRIWLDGYFTAVNKYAEGITTYEGATDVKNGKDNESLMLWLENYCNDNPLNNFLQATFALQRKLQE